MGWILMNDKELRRKYALELADWLLRHGINPPPEDMDELLDITKALYFGMIAEMLEGTAKMIREKVKT